MKVYFEKSDSTFLQGIAILLMVLLHLFAFPERVPEYVSVVNLIDKQGQLLTTIATFGHICVSIFAFVPIGITVFVSICPKLFDFIIGKV